MSVTGLERLMNKSLERYVVTAMRRPQLKTKLVIFTRTLPIRVDELVEQLRPQMLRNALVDVELHVVVVTLDTIFVDPRNEVRVCKEPSDRKSVV